MLIRLSDIQALRPCWEASRLIARVPAGGVTYTQIAEAQDVSVADRRWLRYPVATPTYSTEGRHRDMLIRLSDIQALRPCWEASRLIARVPAGGVTYTQIAEAQDVSVADRRWLLTRLAARTHEGRVQLVLWAAGCAQDVLYLIADEDVRDIAAAAVAAATAWAADPCERTRAAADAASAAARAAIVATWAADPCERTRAAADAASAASAAAESATDAAYAAAAAAYAAYAAAYAAAAATDAAYAAAYAAAAGAAEAQIRDLASAVEAL